MLGGLPETRVPWNLGSGQCFQSSAGLFGSGHLPGDVAAPLVWVSVSDQQVWRVDTVSVAVEGPSAAPRIQNDPPFALPVRTAMQIASPGPD